MESKTLYFLLALSVMVALVTAFEDDGDDELFEDFFENYMEKRGKKKGKGGKKGSQGPCPDRPSCWCAFKDGVSKQLACAQAANGGQVGL